MPDLKLLTPQEVAKILRVSIDALAQLRHRGRGPKFVKLGERRVRYPEDELLRWLKLPVEGDRDGNA